MKVSLEQLVALDFEASCLPAKGRFSFPIEAGIAFVVSGASHTWLIKPLPTWLEQGTWDPASERVYDISLAQLDGEGLPAERVAAELAQALQGKTAVSDAADYDRSWAAVLFGAAGKVPFPVVDFELAIGQILGPLGRKEQAAWLAAEALALKRFPARHRAGADARRL